MKLMLARSKKCVFKPMFEFYSGFSKTTKLTVLGPVLINFSDQKLQETFESAL